MLKLPVLLEI